MDLGCCHTVSLPVSAGAEVRLWNMKKPHATDSQEASVDLGPIVAYAFDPAGRWLATGDVKGVSRFWDLTRKQAVPIELEGGAKVLLESPGPVRAENG